MSGYATITGRIIGPDGLGREGRVEFTPLVPYEGGEVDGRRIVVAHYVVGKLTPDGELVSSKEGQPLRLIAPDSLPDNERNYHVVIDIPGTPVGRKEYFAGIVANTTVDLADIIADRRVTDMSSPKARNAGNGLLEAIDSDEIVEVGGGLLAWKDGISG